MILRPFLQNSVWDLYSYLGEGLPGRRSFEIGTQTEASTAEAERNMEFVPRETENSTVSISTQTFVRRRKVRAVAETQTNPKVFARARVFNAASLGEEKVSSLAQKLLKVSRIAYRLEVASVSEQSQKLVKLRSLIVPLNEEIRGMPPCSLKMMAEQIINSSIKVVRKIELRQEGPFAELERRVEKLEDFCHLNKSYGQREFLWISVMLTPDFLKTEDQLVKEWTPLISKIYQDQAALRKQHVDAEVELNSILKVEIEPRELQVRVSLLFGKIAESFVKMEREIDLLEKDMDKFGKKYSKFQEVRKKISSGSYNNGVSKEITISSSTIVDSGTQTKKQTPIDLRERI